MDAHYAILVSVFLLCSADAKSKKDAPPSFVLPINLRIPEKLVIIGKNSELDNNILCAAENADQIEWKFKKTLNADFSDIPSPFTQTTITEVEGVLHRSLTDTVNMGDRDKRVNLNGYYVCEASNLYGYKTMTPPIRFIIASIKSSLDFQMPIEHEKSEGSPLSLKCSDDRVEITPHDFRLWNIATFSWTKRVDNEQLPINENDRIRINPRTGDLFFAYLEAEDGSTSSLTIEYQCEITISGLASSPVISRQKVRVNAASTTPENRYVMQFPKGQERQESIKCIEGKMCTVTCIFGGRRNGEPPKRTQWESPSSTIGYAEATTSATFLASTKAKGTWTCKHDDNTDQGTVDVTILAYPSVLPSNMADQFVPIGSNVTFACQVAHSTVVDFYYNGTKILPGQTGSSITYNQASKTLTLPNIQRNASANVICISSNDAGTLYRSAHLSVYNKPEISLDPAEGYLLQSNITQITSFKYPFNCSVTLDSKVVEAEIYWETNHTVWTGQKIKSYHSDGISSVISSEPNTATTTGNSILELFIDSTTQDILPGAVWWCSVEFKLYGAKSAIKMSSDKVPFSKAGGNTGRSAHKPAFNSWWIIGVVAAVIFCVLLVVLIICCVEQNKGEQYYVDEKERKAGHDPEAELHAYGFTDFKRSDQEPIPIRRMSLDTSDKPIDSDRGSMEDYGDIDPGRFNEDGSFIGEYGKRNGYDV